MKKDFLLSNAILTALYRLSGAVEHKSDFGTRIFRETKIETPPR